MTAAPPTNRTRLRRNYERGSYDREAIDAILDATPLCHVAYLREGAPSITPTLQWRDGDHVYWHGSSASSALRASKGLPVALAVTLMDGFVLARSAFHHSVNYRSVIIYGTAEPVEDAAEKERALEVLVEHSFPGRWAQLRPITAKELKATGVLRLSLDEASAKIRDIGVVDDEEDYAHPVWAGVVPLSVAVGEPVPDERLGPAIAVPGHVRNLSM